MTRKSRTAVTHPNSATRSYLAVILTLLLFILSSSAQERSPDRGFQAGNKYAISDIETVNMSNGNLMLNIPLASLPAGRGGSGGYQVALHYNSKLWDAGRESRTDGVGHEIDDLFYYREVVYPGGQGGWYLDNGMYQLNLHNRLELEGEARCVPLVGDNEYRRNGYSYKLTLQLPNGSITEFHPFGSGPEYSDYPGFPNGYYSIDPDGVRHNYSYAFDNERQRPLCTTTRVQITTQGMNYFTKDGSGLRLFVPHEPNENYQLRRWTLYFPDGRILENRPSDQPSVHQRLTDRNGNKIYWKADVVNGINGLKIEDETGHFIFIGGDKIIQLGFNGEMLETTLTWKNHWVYRRYRTTHATNANPVAIYDELLKDFSVLEQIKLPTQAGGLEFKFTYNGSDTPPTTGNYTSGLGELSSITLPSGAKAVYSYELDGSTSEDLENFMLVGNSVSARVLNYEAGYDDEVEFVSEVTAYDVNQGVAVSCLPDGSCQTQISAIGGDLNGYAYRTTQTGGAMVEKIWVNKRNLGGAGVFQAIDPLVKTEFTSVSDSSGNPVLTAIKDFEYDQNGNVLEIREYDWVPFSSIPRASTSAVNETLLVPRPTGLPAGLTLKRRTINEYYNPTPNALSTEPNAANHHSNPNSTRLKNVVKSMEIREGNGVVVTKKEFYYDDPSNRGNLTETRTWDSTKGAITSPLSSENSLITKTQFDQYGNPTLTTDAKGNQTQITYGDIVSPSGSVSGLYPTRTVAAFGTPIALTSSITYDFSTGLATTATDVGNGVVTVTERDALGRPTKIRSAAGTSSEAWTRTEYDDVIRRTIVRADVESTGDGKNVSITHFDQLGRVGIVRTLENPVSAENPLGEDPYNPDHGVKVQTRYAFAGPNAFSVTSNPYRARISSLATKEPSMGWTRSKSWNAGKRQETETFAGVAPPAPWGLNTISTGKVSTDIDSKFKTVTDQAGKVRRSMIDGLGRLTRVDEPDQNGVLGEPDSPAQPTSYGYDALGNLRTVQQGAQSRSFSYDSLSRLVNQNFPESGSTGFTYDPNGNLLTRTDARGVVSTNAYDELNRIRSRSYSDGTPTVSYTYDAAGVSNSKGRLTKISSTVSTYSYTGFDAVGRPSGAKQSIGEKDYPLATTYNAGGLVRTMTYPSGRTVNYAYDALGRMSDVTGRLGDGTLRTYASGISYNAASQITKEQFGTSTPIYNKRFYNSRGQLAEIRASTTGPTDNSSDRGAIINRYSNQSSCTGALCNATDNNGNLMRQEIIIPNSDTFSQSFLYDSLNRLEQANEAKNGGAVAWQQKYRYDRFGSRTIDQGSTFGTGIPEPAFGVDAKNRLTVPSGQIGSLSYDAAGNLTSDTYTSNAVLRRYDAENRMTSETAPNDQLTGSYAYDGNGRRVVRNANGVVTWQVYGYSGQLVAEYPANASPNSPQKEYGYRSGELLVVATPPTGGWGPPPVLNDNPMEIGVTTIQARHITELRSAIDSLRSRLGKAAFAWQQQAAMGGLIKPDPILELRSALNDTLGPPPRGYSTGLSQGSSIRAVHIQELRERILAAWNGGRSIKIDWIVSDHLSTPRIIFDQTGTSAGTRRHDYLPFGEDLSTGREATPGYGAIDGVRQKFTSKERDDETALNYFGARYYASSLGRFSGTDPISITKERLTDPARFNMYAYCRNNPMMYIDPDGKDLILANETAKNRARTNIDARLRPEERANIQIVGDRVTVRNNARIKLSTATNAYRGLVEVINNPKVIVNYYGLNPGESIKARAAVTETTGQIVTEVGFAAAHERGAITLYYEYTDGTRIFDVYIPAIDGTPVDGLSGMPVPNPETIVFYHEAIGHSRLDDQGTIDFENSVRQDTGVIPQLPPRSGYDHTGVVVRSDPDLIPLPEVHDFGPNFGPVPKPLRKPD
jgi:RHS repeat-associated protein